jgi:hypothetical protein
VAGSHPLANSLWIVLGLVAALHRSWFMERLRALKLWLLPAVIGLMLAGGIENALLRNASGLSWIASQATLAGSAAMLAILLAALAYDQFQPPAAALLTAIGAQAYGIFLSHTVVLELAARTVYHLWPGLLSQAQLFQAILVVVSVGLPFGLMALVRSSPARQYYVYVFG